MAAVLDDVPACIARLVRAVCIASVALLLCAPARAQGQPIKGQIQVSVANGYGRIVIHLAEEVESEVKVAGGIIVVTFQRPVDVNIESVTAGMADYISAARRDPDGKGLRIALLRKVTVNSMAAGERLFIDLLPETWTGVAPGLPQDVIEDLARRAREAERLLRQQRRWAQQQKPMQIRVRVASQPTFTRYLFELPDVIAVTSDRSSDDLTLTFAAPLVFDLTDAKAALPPVLQSIDTDTIKDSTAVRFAFKGKVDVRTFREERNYVVDIGASDAKESAIVPRPSRPAAVTDNSAKGPLPDMEAPQTVPAKLVSASAPAAREGAAASAILKAAAMGPSEAKPEAKPEAKAEPKPEAKPETRPEAKPQAASERAAPVAAPPQASNAPDTSSSAQAAAAGPVAAASGAAAAEPSKSTEGSGRPNAVAVEMSRKGDILRLTFPFGAATPAAIFRRADTLWLVFDTSADIDLNALQNDTSGTIRSAALTSARDVQIVRVALERPVLLSATLEGDAWIVVLGDAVVEPVKPLGIARNIAAQARASITVPFDDPKSVRRISDPEVGDNLLIVTALGPARGFLKEQNFVEFRVLASTQGIVVQPIADDVTGDLFADKVVIGRPGGLTLSGGVPAGRNSAAFRPLVFDTQLWGFDRQSAFTERQYKLIAAAADASEGRRAAPRVELARFYLAKDMFAEAKGVLDLALAEDRPTADNPSALVLRAITNIMLDRPEAALKDLANPIIGDQYDAPLWRAFAYARQNKWAEARQGFKNVEAAIATLPIELQRLAMKEALRAAIEVRDFGGADKQMHEFETVGIPKGMEPAILVLTGRLAQGLGKNEEALRAFRAAAETEDRPAASEGRLREIALRYGLGDLKRSEVITELETLTSVWRGDETEIEALQLLARLYNEEGRYRDAFHVMRTALKAHPNSELTRRIHDEAAQTFDSLFLAGKGDALPAIDALSLFYDFRELTPIGRRGDEMIRRLADRLVAVDLLYQAGELLQHQIDHRLQGAARAQVAARLAVIYLMDHKPEKAQAVLRSTRINELPTDLRQLRQLLEARALSDIGRHDLALEVIANIDRREAIRLRADILWNAKRYQQAAEQIELLYGDRWRDFQPLNDAERADIMRAAIGYALGEDSIGLGRLRERYAGKMADGPERQAFEAATSPLNAGKAEFNEIVKKIAATDTLDAFLREMRTTFPEIGALSANDLKPSTGSPKGPAGDVMPTGSIPLRPARVSVNQKAM
ncbi:MAG TPA: tetratricopeptide repeat protein [Pseudorhodoplanes sp.]|nr:tetratricopeptide repeat protein [Pseudorhodoplanes sp.]